MKEYEIVAEKRLDEIESALKVLRENLSFDIDLCVSGDTHGIDEMYLYISIREGGHYFERKINY